MCKVIAVTNQKGGSAKTCTALNLGVGLVKGGKKVLLIDLDPQASLTVSLGYEDPDFMGMGIADIMLGIMNEEELPLHVGILHQEEGVDLVPANMDLSGLEVSLVNVMSRESILRCYIDSVKDNYDAVIIDCMPSLGMLTINALVAADSVVIPVAAEYLPVKGLQQLLKTIGKVKKQINRQLEIDGILMTLVDARTNFAKDIIEQVRELYGEKIGVFETMIPKSVKAVESSAAGQSIYKYDAKNKVAEAYMALTNEVVAKGV